MRSSKSVTIAIAGRAACLAAPRIVALALGLTMVLPAQHAGLREHSLLVRERAIHQLTQRGATVIEWMFASTPDSVQVSFPLGEIDRRNAREGRVAFRCGMSMRRYSEAAIDGPPMTDADVGWLLQIPDVKHVDLGGTLLTDAAMAELSRSLPGIKVVRSERDDTIPQGQR